MAQTKSGRVVFFEEVASVEAYVLANVPDPAVKAGLLVGLLIADALKSVSISLNRAAQKPAAAPGLTAPGPAPAQGTVVF